MVAINPDHKAADSVAPALPDRFRIGTLVYTKMGLATLFLWILWGDFCITMLGFIKPNILPLMLREIGASNQSIALISLSIPNLMTMFIAPLISVRSDRFRSRWGRRIPFLLIGTPFLTFFLIMLGFSEPISQKLLGLLTHGGGSVSPRTVALCTVGVFVVCAHFFELVVSTAYYCLINDVVPEAFLARFLALFNMVNRLANFVFVMFILGNALTYTREIFVSISLLYFISFMLMGWRVKEGNYPPPAPRPPGRMGSVTTYFRECFGRKYYVYFFLGVTFFGIASVVGVFQVFFIQSIGLSLDQYGKIAAWTGIPLLLLMYPAGALVDRIHPIRAVLLCLVAYNLYNLVMLVFAHDIVSYAVIYSCFGVLPGAVFNVAFVPLHMKILPRDRYGQFASAAALMGAAATVVFSYAAGVFMDWVGNYRFIFVWTLVFQTLSFLCFYMVYRHWRIHGDTRDEVAPSVSDSTATEVVTN